jgi:anaerobic magnesium-protoporphyrin IX monomethyl ester cyclase
VKNIIILNPTNDAREVSKQPFGLLTIASQFIDNGFNIIWLDADINRGEDLGVTFIKDNICKDTDVSLICTGGLNTTYRFIRDLFLHIEESKIEIPVLVGGRVAKDIDYLLWETIPNLKFICKQEAENIIDWLCKNNIDLINAPGIIHRENGEIIKHDDAPEIRFLDDAPVLRWDLLDPIYFRNGWGSILTSRGCPFRCSFCQTKGEKYRTLGPDRIVDEIKTIVQLFGVNKITIADELFLVQKDRVAELCDYIKPLGIKWRCSSRGDLITLKEFPLLKKMKDSGCERIVMGIESGSNTILNAMHKGETIEQMENAIRLINFAGMEVSATFIFGYPGETKETALESVKWRKKMGFYGGYFYATPYPNTPLYEDFRKNNNLNIQDEVDYIQTSPYIKNIQVNFTDMSINVLKDLDNKCKRMLKDPMPYYLRRIQRKSMMKILPIFAPFFIQKLKLKRGSMKNRNKELAGTRSDEIHIELKNNIDMQ